MTAVAESLPADWFAASPFGSRIRGSEIESTLELLDDWQERYRYIIDLGRELPAMPERLRTGERLVRGCQSQVWVASETKQGKLHLIVDSDAHIVRGLIAIVLSQVQQRTPAEVVACDLIAFFGRIGLLAHLSQTRGNGLRALIARIARTALEAGASRALDQT